MIRTAFISVILIGLFYALWLMNAMPTKVTAVSATETVRSADQTQSSSPRQQNPTRKTPTGSDVPTTTKRRIADTATDTVTLDQPAEDAAVPQPPTQAEVHQDSSAKTSEPPLRWATDPDGIKAAIQELTPKVKQCYEGWLKATNDNDALNGKILLRMTIDAQDEEASARMLDTRILSNELKNEFMTGCIINLTQSLRFDIPDEPVKLQLPFIFGATPEN